MRIIFAFAASLFLISDPSAGIPQSTAPTSSQQAATLLAQSTKLLTGSSAVTDVTLTGTAEWIAGSDDETGTATYKAVGGAYRLDMSFRNGTLSEIVSPVNGLPSGKWIGLDGTSHPMAMHNLNSDPGWFPALTLGNVISSPISVLTYVGQETRNGSAVIHLSAYQQSPNISVDVASSMQHFTQVEIYLDPSTFLPISYICTLHPDNNALVNIPIEIRYSNYQSVAGGQAPFHVQKYINGTLAIDLQIKSASVNTGISVTQITAQ